MPFSYVQYPGNGSTVTFTVPFPYLLRAHVKLYYGLSLQSGGYTQLLADGVNYTWTSATQVQLSAAPVVGQTLSIRRETPTTSRLVDWSDGSALTADALDTADLQNFYAIQEHKDYIEVLGINPNTNVTDGSITANKLSSDAVTTIKIQDGAVTSSKIQDGAIVNADVNAAAGIAAGKLSFTQTGTGAVTRTVDSKLKDVVSVKDFGAVGDGTTNDTTALQNAANYAVANYKSLYFPAGVYLTRQRIAFTGVVNISIFGDGYCNTQIKLQSLTGVDANAVVSISDQAANVVVRGLYFTVDGASVNVGCCLGIERASSIFVTDCFFGGGYYNLLLRGVIDSGVDNCSFEFAAYSNIKFDQNGSSDVSGIASNSWSPSNPGIWAFGTARVSVNNCIIVSAGGGTNNSNLFTFNGVTLNNAVATVFTGCHFYGNTDTNAYLLAAVDTHFIGCHFGDPVGGSSDKNFIIVNNSTSNLPGAPAARLYLTGCNFGDGNAGATPIKDAINLGYLPGSEAHIVNCKINATPTRNLVYDNGGGGTLKTWFGGPAPISTLSGVSWAVCTDGRWMWSNGAYKTYYKHGRPASTTDGALFSGGLEASTTYDPPSLNNGVGVTTALTCAGAAFGDVVTASFSLNLQGVILSAWVSAANTVAVHFFNASGGTLDLASGTVRVRVDKA